MDPHTETPPARSPWRRPGFIIALTFVVLIVAAGLIATLVLPHRHAPATHAGSTPTATAPNSATAPGTAPTGSTVDATPGTSLPTAIPTRPPADVTWQLFGQTAVPVSASAGPRTIAGGVASGYAHTPDGALLAAAQLGIRAGHAAGRASWEPTVTRQFMPGSDRDQLLTALRAAPDSPTQPGELSPIAGYQYQSYSPDTAVVGIVYRTSGSATPYAVIQDVMVWRDGDWRMTAPPGGNWLLVKRQAASLDGAVPWGAT